MWYNDVEGENAPVFTYSYNAEGNLTSSTDSINNRAYVYAYDTSGRAVQKIVKDTSCDDTATVIAIEQ